MKTHHHHHRRHHFRKYYNMRFQRRSDIVWRATKDMQDISHRLFLRRMAIEDVGFAVRYMIPAMLIVLALIVIVNTWHIFGFAWSWK